MAYVIRESGMDFIAENAFRIEKSRSYTHLSDGVRSVEFVRLIDDKLWFVEAKTTFADPNNPSEENNKKFQSELDEVCEKFIHSLNLYSSIEVGVTEDFFPSGFVPPEKISLVFLLVIKNHELKWCKKIKQKLTDVLPLYLKKIWKPEVYVLNHKAARDDNLTTA